MSDNRMRIWFALFVLAVFGVGLASGVLLGRQMIAPPPPFEGPAGPFGMGGRGRGPGPGARGDLLLRLTEELQLSSDQQAQVRAVLETRRERLEQMQTEVHDRFEREQASLRDEIRKVLTPGQQQKFEKWLAAAPPQRGRGMRR